MGEDGIWHPWVVEVCHCSLFILLSSSPFSTPWFLVCNRFSINLFQKNGFVGVKESTSLWVEIPVGVRLPTAGSSQTPRKWDPHWELLLLLLYSSLLMQPKFQVTIVLLPFPPSSVTPKTQIPKKRGAKKKEIRDARPFGSHHPLPSNHVSQFTATSLSLALLNKIFNPNENTEEEGGNNGILNLICDRRYK